MSLLALLPMGHLYSRKKAGISMQKNTIFSLFVAITCLFVTSKGSAEMIQYPSMTASLEKALPAVVFVANETNYFDMSFADNPDSYYSWFPSVYEFFRPYYLSRWPIDYSHGSGFIFHPDGYVITNAHVVEGVSSTLVALQSPDLRIIRASLVYTDESVDIAILKLDNPDGRTFPYLAFGDSDSLQIGEPVALIGTPKSPVLESTVTIGAVSGKARNGFIRGEIDGYIQTDASTNSGNSGGPLINQNGSVVGVISWAYSHYWGNEGLGFAVPSNIVQRIANQIVSEGVVSQGYLGVSVNVSYESAFETYKFESLDGATILKVHKDSPAEYSGLEKDDRIFEANHIPIRSHHSLKNFLYAQTPGTDIQFKIVRDGEILDKTAKLADEHPVYSDNTSWIAL